MHYKNKQFYLKKRPQGIADLDSVPLKESDITQIEDGQLLIENHYFSIDPAIRGWMRDEPSYMPPIELGEVIRSSTVGTVIESRHPEYSVGDVVYGINGWETHSVSNGYFLTKIPDNNRYPLSYYLSVMGAVGLTAYFGITDRSGLKPGETLLMSAAAGAVGSLGGQIAKLMGCRVVGIAGSEEKCARIKALGFDDVINYKTTDDMTAAIAKACPEGVDVYFDNVGGEILDAALMNLKSHGRVLFCGSISSYNATEPVPGPYNWWQILARSAEIRGFLVSDYFSQFASAAETLGQWLDDGKIEFNEEIVEGFENCLLAFNRLFDGSNQGKLLIKI
ncbi:NADP-dependent oxidoreductase [Aestuariicella hydrocarbonica]|uniref:NADP-dependent oxidoreductase n=1 Tax=Pseudomaricurvus hydrocarbonicus TaxID=1470433 RepID=A0A9E5JU06_9GAMM|nr:NADP-dependent oxidoreductase [Aestuariicella hydrocarbonica]NHO66822.1 NADP-dependent oxidoreductase [Aestuariicella hydrocarbonica]